LEALMTQKAVKCSVWLAAFGLVVTASSLAQAQTLGVRHDFTIGVERVFGMYSGRVELERPPLDYSVETTSFGLAFQRPISMLATPRVSFDYFIIPSLSLGGTLGFDSADPGGDPDNNDEESGAVLFAPRVGYAIPFNTEWGVWFRGGLTYVAWDTDDNDEGTSLMALSGEAAFYFMPVPAVGFTGGPVLDLGISGEERWGNQDVDYNERLFGLAFGMFARF
jgi:hypothetical protein